MTLYYRPIVQYDSYRPQDARTLAGGWTWFDRVEVLQRGGPARVIAASDLPEDVAHLLTGRRRAVAGMDFSAPRLMAILNVTPDSFSDGGAFLDPKIAARQARAFAKAGADILDIGAESTRPGAATVPDAEEIARLAPVLAQLAGADIAISLDTRKSSVARSGVAAGVALINDVSGFTFDPALAGFCAENDLAVCIMHGPFDPAEMQRDPNYADVLLDVYDFLSDQISMLERLGLDRRNIIVDPGIGFGKTQAHNLALVRGLSVFHGLGCPVLLGASRKKFIGQIGGAAQARDRAPGSIAVALAGVAQGVQILRIHDVVETRQALDLWLSVTGETK